MNIPHNGRALANSKSVQHLRKDSRANIVINQQHEMEAVITLNKQFSLTQETKD